jgi:hypothetical protein
MDPSGTGESRSVTEHERKPPIAITPDQMKPTAIAPGFHGRMPFGSDKEMTDPEKGICF